MTEQIFAALETEAQRLGHGITSLFHHHPHPSATITTSSTKEAPVSVLDELKTDARTFVDRLETFDAEAIAKVDAIKANPEAAAVFDVLASVAKAELPSGLITAVTSGLGLLTKMATHGAESDSAAPADATHAEVPTETPQPVSAGPVVAGAAT